jgi:hypothetical protein
LFITADGQPAANQASLNPIMFMPLDDTNAIGKNLGTGGDFTANGPPTALSQGGPYIEAGYGEGGMVWCKMRDNTLAYNHNLFDTNRGVRKFLESNTTDAEGTASAGYSLTSFNSNGFTLGTNWNNENRSSTTNVSWSFRKAEKFFDVVTWTGNATAGREIAHNLGSVPGVMIVKAASGTYSGSAWTIYHKDLTATDLLEFDTGATKTRLYAWNDTTPTDSVFTVGSGSETNGGSTDYVAYLFASDAGGFGEDGDESVVKCGSYVGNISSPPTIDLGWEPQYILFKAATTTANWCVFDVMRGWATSAETTLTYNDALLHPNTSAAESLDGLMGLTSTGFKPKGGDSSSNGNGVTYIYIAIRRPMKTPTAGTEVFAMDTLGSTGDANQPGYRSPFPVDMGLKTALTGNQRQISTRLLQGTELLTESTAAEAASSSKQFDYMNGTDTSTATSSVNMMWMFKRATGFMDVVAYSGTGVAGATQAHNLGVVPEFMIVKPRGSGNWATYNKFNTATDLMYLNEIYASDSNGSIWNNTTPTDTVFTLGSGFLNTSNAPFIAYLFASLDGVSKVGSYTGTGSDLNVDCGFSAGARFILIKRTDGSQYASGDWYVWDSVRGISAGNDPYFFLNSTAAEVTNTDYIDPLSSGFTVTSSAPAALNASGGTYIFLAIA